MARYPTYFKYGRGGYRNRSGAGSQGESKVPGNNPGSYGMRSGGEATTAEPLAWPHPHFGRPAANAPGSYQPPPVAMSLGELVPLGRAAMGFHPLGRILNVAWDMWELYEWMYPGVYTESTPAGIPGYEMCYDPCPGGITDSRLACGYTQVIDFISAPNCNAVGCFNGQGLSPDGGVVGGVPAQFVWALTAGTSIFGSCTFPANGRYGMHSVHEKTGTPPVPLTFNETGTEVALPLGDPVVPDWMLPHKPLVEKPMDGQIPWDMIPHHDPGSVFAEATTRSNGDAWAGTVGPLVRRMQDAETDTQVVVLIGTTVRTRNGQEFGKRKVRLNPGFLKLLIDAISVVGEFGDIVEALFDALPEDCKKYPSGQRITSIKDMAGAITSCGARMNPEQAVWNLVLNEIEDRLIGMGNQQRNNFLREIGMYGPSAPFGGITALRNIGLV